MVFFGILFIVLGLILWFTIIGAFFGFPMILIGIGLCIAGAMRRKQVVQQTVVISNTPQQGK